MDGSLGPESPGQGGKGQQAALGHHPEESGQAGWPLSPTHKEGLVSLNSHLEFREREGGGLSIWGVLAYA